MTTVTTSSKRWVKVTIETWTDEDPENIRQDMVDCFEPDAKVSVEYCDHPDDATCMQVHG